MNRKRYFENQPRRNTLYFVNVIFFCQSWVIVRVILCNYHNSLPVSVITISFPLNKVFWKMLRPPKLLIISGLVYLRR